MKKVLFIMLWATIAVAGCKKEQTPVATAEDAITVTPNEGGQDEANVKPVQVVKAEGEMKQLLLVLHRVHFSFDTSTLTEPARRALVEASEKLQEMPDVALVVEGHTDIRGTNEYNLSLSERRAQTVVNYMANLGVEPDRLSITSFGEERPLVAGTGELTNAQNRRVDFRLRQGNIEFALEEGTLLDDHGKELKLTP
jgi:peptidoglycan-associated lipoprotein